MTFHRLTRPAAKSRIQRIKNSYGWTVPYIIILFIFFVILKAIIP